MKKMFILSFLLFVSCFLFCNENIEFIKEIKNRSYNFSYKVYENTDNTSYISINDDKDSGYRNVKILCDSVSDAFSYIYHIENFLADLQNKAFDSNDIDNQKCYIVYTNFMYSFLENFVKHLENNMYDFEYEEVDENGKISFVINAQKEFLKQMSEKYTILTVLDHQSFGIYNKELLDEFEKANPYIRIRREVCDDSSYSYKIWQYADANNMPDVFYMWPSGRSSVIHEKKLAKDLTSFLKEDGLYDSYLSTALDPSYQLSNCIYEIPSSIMLSNCLYVNTKVLKECKLEPADTYEKLKKQVRTLKRKGKSLISMGNKDSWVMQSCLFSMVIGRYAGKDWAKDLYSKKAKFTDKKYVDAVKMIERMYKDNVISRDTLNSSYADIPYHFAQEESAYMIDGDWRAGAFCANENGYSLISEERQKSDIEIMLFPKLPGEKYHLTSSGSVGPGYGMSASLEKGSKKEKAAWTLIKWLSGPICQQYRFDTGISFPSLTTGINYDNTQSIIEKRSKFYSTAKDITPVFDSVFSSEVSSVLNTMLYKLGQKEASVKDVCNEVQKAIDKQIQ